MFVHWREEITDLSDAGRMENECIIIIKYRSNGKKVLILSSSPRRRGNSDTLCDEFMRGAIEGGNEVEKVFLRDKNIHPCLGCSVCSYEKKPCPQKDDAAEVIQKMLEADVIVMGTPVYFMR